MIREVIATGRDVNAAIDNGCAELGVARENAQFEIISLPKKGFLGLKTYPAKVKVFEELPDLPRPAPKPAPTTVKKPAPAAAKPAPAPAPVKAAPAPAQRSAPVQQPKPTEAKPAVQRPPHEQRQPKPAERTPRDEDNRENNRDFGEHAPQAEIVPTTEMREKVEKAAVYLAEIMRAMGFDTIEVTPAYYSENVCLRLSGAQLGVVIGRRGETLDALQYLTSLVANRGEGDYIRVNIDSGNYREKREKTLTALAKKLALQAVRSGKSTTLEPMNPYERRVIHGAVSQIRGAVSTSVGADPNRRVVISAADGAKRSGGEAVAAPDRSRGGRGRNGDRDRRDRDTKAPTTPRTPLRPNTNTAESVAAAKSAPVVTRTDDGAQAHTATFAATRTRPEAPSHSPAPAPTTVPASGKKLSDAELYGDIPMGVPIVSGDRPAVPKAPAAKPAPKPEPKKLEGTLYGKVE